MLRFGNLYAKDAGSHDHPVYLHVCYGILVWRHLPQGYSGKIRIILVADVTMVFLLLLITQGVLFQAHPAQFRAAFYSQFVFLGLWLFPLVVLPETPVFYCKQGKHDQAKKSLRRLIGDVEGYDLEHEYACIRYEVEQSEAALKLLAKSRWVSVFKGKNLKRVAIGALPLMLQGIAGAALTFGYSTYVHLASPTTER